MAKKEKHIGRMDSCEKQLFFEAMTKEWKQLFELGALRLLTSEESKAVPQDRIIPSRWILTDKYDGLAEQRSAKTKPERA